MPSINHPVVRIAISFMAILASLAMSLGAYAFSAIVTNAMTLNKLSVYAPDFSEPRIIVFGLIFLLSFGWALNQLKKFNARF